MQRDTRKITDFANSLIVRQSILFALPAHPRNVYHASRGNISIMGIHAVKEQVYFAFRPQGLITLLAKQVIMDVRAMHRFRSIQMTISFLFVFHTAHQRQSSSSFYNTQIIHVVVHAVKVHQQVSLTRPHRLTTRFTITLALASMAQTLHTYLQSPFSIIMAPTLRLSSHRSISLRN